eukprot:scaffold9467_cov121-Skeletonema_marinoi.AAC.1
MLPPEARPVVWWYYFLHSISDLILVKWHVTCIMMVDDTIRGPADFLRQTAKLVALQRRQ